MSCRHDCKPMIGPSLLASDLSRLAEESKRVLDAGADYLHLDVMDGNFVPNITIGAPVIKCLRQNVPAAFFDCHMMVATPEQWVEDIADAGAEQFTFHYETTGNPQGLIRQIKEAGMKVGLAVKPKTDIGVVEEYIQDIDMVLVMTVEPGFGGQKFMADMMPKVEHLRRKYRALNIEVDGGLGPNTIEAAATAGANWIVAGSSVFNAEDPSQAIEDLRLGVIKHGHGKS